MRKMCCNEEEFAEFKKNVDLVLITFWICLCNGLTNEKSGRYLIQHCTDIGFDIDKKAIFISPSCCTRIRIEHKNIKYKV